MRCVHALQYIYCWTAACCRIPYLVRRPCRTRSLPHAGVARSHRAIRLRATQETETGTLRTAASLSGYGAIPGGCARNLVKRLVT